MLAKYHKLRIINCYSKFGLLFRQPNVQGGFLKVIVHIPKPAMLVLALSSEKMENVFELVTLKLFD